MMRPSSRSRRTSCVSLWCVLITAAFDDTIALALSIRSGRSVPCARNTSSARIPGARRGGAGWAAGAGPVSRWRVCARVASRARTLFLAHLWVTRMKVSPMIFRFSSGEVVSASAAVWRPPTSVVAAAKAAVASSTSSSTPTARSCRRHRRRFLLTHEAVVDMEGDHALAADGFVEERRTHA